MSFIFFFKLEIWHVLIELQELHEQWTPESWAKWKKIARCEKISLLDSYLLQRAKQSLFSLKLVQSTEFTFTKSRLYCMKEINVILVYQFHEID